VVTFLSFLDVDSSLTSTSVLPQGDSTPDSTETDLPGESDWPFDVFDSVFGRLLDSDLLLFADVQRYLHMNISGFSTEACAAKENSGPCVYIYWYDSFINGNETCSLYTIGSCDEDIRR
jgi:hypothetical protein